MDQEFSVQDYGAACHDPEIFMWALLEECRNAAKVRRIDDTHILVPDWGQVITLESKLSPAAAGIRAFDFLTGPPEEDTDACIRFVLHAPRFLEEDGSMQVRFRPDVRQEYEMVWMVPREQWTDELETIRYLYVRKSDLRWYCR